MPKEMFKHTHRNTKRGGISSAYVLRARLQAENVAQDSDGAPLNGWELFLERIRVGSSLDQEAERLQVSVHTLRQFVYNRRFPERKEAYRAARADGAEAEEDEYKAKAKELLGDGWTDSEGNLHAWNRDMVAARKEGLFHMFNRLKYANRERYGDAQTVRHEHDVSGALLERLEAIAADRKERARLEHQPGPVLDVEWSEVEPEVAKKP